MPSRVEQAIQLDFIPRGDKLIPRSAAKIRETPIIVDSRRMIQISAEGKVTAEVLVLEGYPYPLRRKKPPTPFLYMGTIPEEIINLPWDLKAMWFFSQGEDPTAYKLGPVVDLKASFPELTRMRSGLGFTILTGGVVFNPDKPQLGLYRKLDLSPETTKLWGIGA